MVRREETKGRNGGRGAWVRAVAAARKGQNRGPVR